MKQLDFSDRLFQELKHGQEETSGPADSRDEGEVAPAPGREENAGAERTYPCPA